MPNYYEILQVAPGASDAEILDAYEAQYNQWRRLVTHHDPTVVNQANQTLQALETIRETLSDPSRRAAYDAGIGLGGPVGGLADPTALFQSLQQPGAAPMTPHAPMAPPTPRAAAATAPSAPTSLWSCYKCQTDNPAQTKFCFKCGAQLVRQCPECHKETSLIATGICGECGSHYERAMHRVATRSEIASLDQEIGAEQKKLQEAANASYGGPAVGCGGVVLILGFLMLCIAVQSQSGIWLALMLLLIGGGALYRGLSSRGQHRSKAATINQSLQSLAQKRRVLQADLDGVDLTMLPTASLPAPQPNSGAHIVFNSSNNSWTCSACGGFVRQGSELCKHCKVRFS